MAKKRETKKFLDDLHASNIYGVDFHEAVFEGLL
jgi:hypothetical protein